MPPFPLIQQDKVGANLQGQGDRLRFAPVQITAQGGDQRPVLDGVPFDPVGTGDLIAARPTLAFGVQFLPDPIGDVHATIKMV